MEKTSMICKWCSCEDPAGGNYCIRCGYPLDRGDVALPGDTVEAGAAPKKRGKGVLIAASFIAFIALTLIFVYAATGSSEAVQFTIGGIIGLGFGIGSLILLVMFVISRLDTRRTFFVPAYYSRDVIIQTSIMAFSGRGYAMTGSWYNSASFAKYKKPNIAVAVLLLFLWLIPGIVYIAFAHGQDNGAVTITDAFGGGYNVTVDGPKPVAKLIGAYLSPIPYSYAPAGYVGQQQALPPGVS